MCAPPSSGTLCSGATVCRDLKGIDTDKTLCDYENCVRNAVRTAEEAPSCAT